MDKEVVVLGPDEVIRLGLSGVNEKDLPAVIQEQVGKLDDLDKSVKKAMEAAVLANDSATIAKNMSTGFGKKKIAIEELQSAGLDLATAVQMGVQAQKISFEFQTKLAEISKYLFGLGASNIASNRFVVRELEMKLKGASREKLSELARQELITVVKQLKEQEDILNKVENLSETIKSHDKKLKAQVHDFTTQGRIVSLHSDQLRTQEKINNLQEKQLINRAKDYEELKDKLGFHAELDRIHEEQLKVLEESILKYEKHIDYFYENDTDLSLQIKNNLKIIKAQEIEINTINDDLIKLKTSLDSKANSTISKVTLVVAITAFIMSLIHFMY